MSAYRFDSFCLQSTFWRWERKKHCLKYIYHFGVVLFEKRAHSTFIFLHTWSFIDGSTDSLQVGQSNRLEIDFVVL